MTPPRHLLISSVRVSTHVLTQGGHDIVEVWSRGGKAGTLVVEAGDGERIAALLQPQSTVGGAAQPDPKVVVRRGDAPDPFADDDGAQM